MCIEEQMNTKTCTALMDETKYMHFQNEFMGVHIPFLEWV